MRIDFEELGLLKERAVPHLTLFVLSNFKYWLFTSAGLKINL